MIQSIERLPAKLQTPLLADRHDLKETCVQILISGSMDEVSGAGAKCTQRVQCDGAGIEILGDLVCSGTAVVDRDRPGNVCMIKGYSDQASINSGERAEWQSCLPFSFRFTTMHLCLILHTACRIAPLQLRK